MRTLVSAALALLVPALLTTTACSGDAWKESICSEGEQVTWVPGQPDGHGWCIKDGDTVPAGMVRYPADDVPQWYGEDEYYPPDRYPELDAFVTDYQAWLAQPEPQPEPPALPGVSR